MSIQRSSDPWSFRRTRYSRFYSPFDDSLPVTGYRSRAEWRALLERVGLRHLRGPAPEEVAADDPILRAYVEMYGA